MRLGQHHRSCRGGSESQSHCAGAWRSVRWETDRLAIVPREHDERLRERVTRPHHDRDPGAAGRCGSFSGLWLLVIDLCHPAHHSSLPIPFHSTSLPLSLTHPPTTQLHPTGSPLRRLQPFVGRGSGCGSRHATRVCASPWRRHRSD